MSEFVLGLLVGGGVMCLFAVVVVVVALLKFANSFWRQ